MKIHEVSELTGVNIETIRSYRKKGLIHPEQLENGYYDYDDADVNALLYIRKMRGLNVPLSVINNFFKLNDEHSLVEALEREKQLILSQIEQLKEKASYLQFEQEHIRDSHSTNIISVKEQYFGDDKFGLYKIDTEIDMQLSEAINAIPEAMTSTILIDQDILNGPIEDRVIPIVYGFGSYRKILEEHHIPISDRFVKVPAGNHLTYTLKLSDQTEINVRDIAPLISYAKEHHLRFVSPTTAYLYRVQIENDQHQYLYRIRAKVEPTE